MTYTGDFTHIHETDSKYTQTQNHILWITKSTVDSTHTTWNSIRNPGDEFLNQCAVHAISIPEDINIGIICQR